jgi:hypothetical protein
VVQHSKRGTKRLHEETGGNRPKRVVDYGNGVQIPVRSIAYDTDSGTDEDLDKAANNDIEQQQQQQQQHQQQRGFVERPSPDEQELAPFVPFAAEPSQSLGGPSDDNAVGVYDFEQSQSQRPIYTNIDAGGKSKFTNQIGVITGYRPSAQKPRGRGARGGRGGRGGGKQQNQAGFSDNWIETVKPASLVIGTPSSNFKRVWDRYFISGLKGYIWCCSLDELVTTNTFYLNLRFLVPGALGYIPTKVGVCFPINLFGKHLLTAFVQHNNKLGAARKKREAKGYNTEEEEEASDIIQSGTRVGIEQGTLFTTLQKPSWGNSLGDYRVFIEYTNHLNNKTSEGDIPVAILPQLIESLKTWINDFCC